MKRVNGWTAMLGIAALMGTGAALTGCGGEAVSDEVAIEVTDAGFVPAVAKLPKGKAATLLVTRKTAQTCATEMVFVTSGEKHDLPLNETVRIELPADRAETMDYACAMDMIKGKIVSK